MAGKDVAKAVDNTVAEVVDAVAGVIPRDGDVISQYLKTEAASTELTPVVKHEQIIRDILAAKTLEEALEVLEPEDLDQFNGRELDLLSFDIQDSEYEAGAPIYVSIKVRDIQAGTKHLINTGEQALMAQLLKLQQIATWPVRVRVHKSTKPNRFNTYLHRFAMPAVDNG